ncbi:hypothetical protein [Paraburkholderia strydomiana]|uniref:hypothetical protein n=1 Tax=Paraburkholderia strydomiana TaxID=1245417 RepID=UPI0038B791BE
MDRLTHDVARKLPLCFGRNVLIEGEVLATLCAEPFGDHPERRGLAGAGVRFHFYRSAGGDRLERVELFVRRLDCFHTLSNDVGSEGL